MSFIIYFAYLTIFFLVWLLVALIWPTKPTPIHSLLYSMESKYSLPSSMERQIMEIVIGKCFLCSPSLTFSWTTVDSWISWKLLSNEPSFVSKLFLLDMPTWLPQTCKLLEMLIINSILNCGKSGTVQEVNIKNLDENMLNGFNT